MKFRVVLSILCLFFIINAKAQKSFAVLRGGVNFANVSTTPDGRIEEANMLTSLQAGIIGNIHILPFLSFQPGILFTGKGSKTQSGSTSDPTYFRSNSNPWYVEIPANIVFRSPGPLKLFVGAGPYLGIGFAGKNTSDGKYLGVSFHSERSIKWSNDDPTTLNYEEGAGFGIMRRFDYGLNGTAGIETRMVVLAVNYGLGLAKLQSGTNSSADDNNKHRVLSFTIGFKL